MQEFRGPQVFSLDMTVAGAYVGPLDVRGLTAARGDVRATVGAWASGGEVRFRRGITPDNQEDFDTPVSLVADGETGKLDVTADANLWAVCTGPIAGLRVRITMYAIDEGA